MTKITRRCTREEHLNYSLERIHKMMFIEQIKSRNHFAKKFNMSIILIVILCLFFGAWYISIQIYRNSYVNFDQFKSPTVVQAYFEEIWKLNQTPKSQVETALNTLGIRNCYSMYIDNEPALECTVLGPRPEKTQYDDTYLIQSIISDMYIMHFYKIYFHFKDDKLNKIVAIYTSSLPIGGL